MLSWTKILILVVFVSSGSRNVFSKPQGAVPAADVEDEALRRAAAISSCVCFDYTTMCSTPPPSNTTDEPSDSTTPVAPAEDDAPATTPNPEQPEPKALEDIATTASPDETNSETTPAAPSSSEQAPPTTAAPEEVTTAAPQEVTTPAPEPDQASPTTAAPNAETTAASPEEVAATTPISPDQSSPATTAAAPSEETPTEAPAEPQETTEPNAPPAEPASDSQQRTPKKLDEPEPSPITNEAPAAEPDTAPQPNPSNQGADPNALDSLTKLLAELNEKLRKLEESHENLNKNIGLLEDRLKEYEKIIPEVKSTTTDALTDANPEKAVEQWKNLQTIIDDPQELQNVTNDIVATACDKNVSPPDTMNFIHNLPTTDTTIVDSAYNTLADKMSNNEPLQEQMYWKDMTPYCQAVAQDIGQNSPTTNKMYNLQNEMRLNAAQPIKQCSQQINQQQYDPAYNTWNNMTADIADNPNQLKTNMQKLILKAYDGDVDSLPYVFQFVFILPETQEEYKDVAFECLRNEMNNNGHSFIYQPQQQQNQQGPQQQGPQQQGPPPPPGNVYNYRNNY